MKQGIYLIIFLMTHSGIIIGQNKKVTTYNTSIVLGGGINSFRGDVCSSCANLGPSLSVSSRFFVTKKIFFRPEFFYNFHTANDENENNERGLSFSNHTIGVNTILEYALYRPDPKRLDRRGKSEFYIHTFLGVFTHNPTAVFNGERTVLAGLSTEGQTYSRLVPQIGLGINGNFQMGKKRFGAQLDGVFLFSDYVDDVSQNYISTDNLPELRAFAIDPSGNAEIGSRRGSNESNDFYIRLLITYEFIFKKKTSI